MQTAHIYYLDIKNNPEMFINIQFGGYVPTFEQFNEHWEKVGADEVPNSTEDALSELFGKWQAGTPEIESEAFQNAEVRNMTVGDVIMLDDASHLVKPVGFEEVPF